MNIDPIVFEWPGKVILIAEDEDVNFKFLEKVLADTHVAIIRAHNGKEVLSILQGNSKIDLILMDIRMPEMNGFDTTVEIKHKYKIPVIAQTAYNIEFGKEKGIESGCDEYIVKPINISKLLVIMDKYLANPKAKTK